jgi:thiol-disulfide isomerase/thioredoxin
MKWIYCLMILLCPFVSIAQVASGTAPLKIGERVPGIGLRSVINAPFTAASIAAFDDKLLLVDFWATCCGSCIKEFPKLDSLSTKFKDRVTVLLVNNAGSGDDEKKVTAFLERKRNPSGKKYNMAIVIDDTLLAGLFPHLTIPHTAWIYKGKFIAVTESASVTAKNIEAVLAGRPVALEMKTDQLDFDYHKPLLENGNGGSWTSLLYRSMFTAYLDGAGGAIGQGPAPDSSYRRKFYINKPVLSLYSYAFPKLAGNRRLVDRELYTLLISDSQDLAWRRVHYFCYEQGLPPGTTALDQQRFMQLDLDRQFGLYSRVEKRLVDCYVLGVKDTALLVGFRSKGAKTAFTKKDSGGWSLHNAALAVLVEVLNRQPPAKTLVPIVIDETGYSAPVDLDLDLADLHDIAALQKILAAFGLRLLPASREIDMLVISKSIFNPKIN